VFVRAGAFVPMAKVVQSTRDYSTREIDLHYYHDAAVKAGSGKLYDDDGETAQAFEAGKYEIVRFSSRNDGGKLEISLATETGKQATPAARTFALKVHNVAARPRGVSIGGRAVQYKWDARRKLLEVAVPLQPRQSATVVIGLRG
jgi:alpha-glucosidase/oligosaccharide 4-alpha-D-glucosyltransferase